MSVADAERPENWFVRAAAVVGDLSNPFYREERQRDVWNEASAVGLQVVLWLSLAAATAMVWLGAAPALPYATTVLAVVGVAVAVTGLYAHRLGVRIDDPRGLLRLRMLPYVGLVVAFFVGVVRVEPADGFFEGFSQGMVLGSACALAWLLGSGLRARRREAREAR